MGSCGSIPIAAEPTATASSGGTQSSSTATAYRADPAAALHAIEQRLAVTEAEAHSLKVAAVSTAAELSVTKRDLAELRAEGKLAQELLHIIQQKQQAADRAEQEADVALLALCLSTLPPVERTPTPAEIASRVITIDAFLSHKRTDAADFARVLNTELTDVAGLKCFLDQDADFELGDLMSKVRGSKALVFILSDHILESQWCALELREALIWGVEVILLTMHGAKWIINGHTHDFPPSAIIRPEIAAAFGNKAIEYNRSAHKAVIDQLLLRIYGKPVKAAFAQWKVPARKERAFEFTDLISMDSEWGHLELPPSNRLLALDGLISWNEGYNLVCPPLDRLCVVAHSHQRVHFHTVMRLQQCIRCGIEPAEIECQDCDTQDGREDSEFWIQICVQCDREVHASTGALADHKRIPTLGRDPQYSTKCGICNTACIRIKCATCEIGLCPFCTCDHLKAVASDSTSAPPIQCLLMGEMRLSTRVRTNLSVLLLDGSPQSVQVGRAMDLKCFHGEFDYYQKFPVTFRSGTRPEVFVALNGFVPREGTKPKSAMQLILTAKQISERGFSLVITAAKAEEKKMQAKFSVSWLVFDPRLNRPWVHGEVWITLGDEDAQTKENRRTDGNEKDHITVQFVSDAVSCSSPPPPRASFTSPPLVFTAIGGLEMDAAVELSIATSDITERGFYLQVTMRPPPSTPQKVCVRWLALPSNAPPLPTDLCSYTATGPTERKQPLWRCITCQPTWDQLLICEVCMRTCHANCKTEKYLGPADQQRTVHYCQCAEVGTRIKCCNRGPGADTSSTFVKAAAIAAAIAAGPTSSALASAATLIRLNSLLMLIPLTIRRRELTVGPLDTQVGRVCNYSALFADVSSRGRIPDGLPSPATIHSGDIVRTWSNSRGVSRHFALWLKKGMPLPGDSPSLLPRQFAFESERKSSIGDEVVLELEDMIALQTMQTNFEHTIPTITAIMQGKYLSEVIEAVKQQHIDLESIYWTVPSEPCPVLLMPESKLDPMDASQQLADTHDLYLFSHPDEEGDLESFVSTLAPNDYVFKEAASHPQPRRLVDPLLALAESSSGGLVRQTMKGAMAGEPAFPSQMFGILDKDSKQEWHPVARQQHLFSYGSSLEETRALIAEHLLWLESRIQQSFPSVASQLQLQSSVLDDQRVNDAPLRTLMVHLKPIPVPPLEMIYGGAHAHPLTKQPAVSDGVKFGTYSCNHCRRRGCCMAYRCAECDYNMHPECAEAQTVPPELVGSIVVAERVERSGGGGYGSGGPRRGGGGGGRGGGYGGGRGR